MALLEASGVTVQFGGVTAVDNASIAVEPGSITGLIGPNGAGKTTLFNVISGLQAPTKGRVRFRGQNVTRSSVNSRAKAGMGRTFQRLEAFGSLTVRENVLVAREIHAGARSWFTHRQDRVVDQLIDRVGLREYAGQRADSVPTGVARLLEMARALAIEPRLLLLDEPSSGLDEAETEAFGELLKELAADQTAILLVEHDMDLVMSCCEIIHVLEFGKVIATGTPAEIRANRTVQAAYLGFVDDTDGAGSTVAALDEVAGAGTYDTDVLASVPAVETTVEFPRVEEEL
ncbi:MAG: branched-chain amino acid transport system ATP-binding protein [Pseudonocardiales bacterium]|jgi:branched-chain amino acid transport system ATP-binding protein|nr:branched-chain amino acid transport system ATP-binding protein [Pseudonocardiales bacterium]